MIGVITSQSHIRGAGHEQRTICLVSRSTRRAAGEWAPRWSASARASQDGCGARIAAPHRSDHSPSNAGDRQAAHDSLHAGLRHQPARRWVSLRLHPVRDFALDPGDGVLWTCGGAAENRPRRLRRQIVDRERPVRARTGREPDESKRSFGHSLVLDRQECPADLNAFSSEILTLAFISRLMSRSAVRAARMASVDEQAHDRV